VFRNLNLVFPSPPGLIHLYISHVHIQCIRVKFWSDIENSTYCLYFFHKQLIRNELVLWRNVFWVFFNIVFFLCSFSSSYVSSTSYSLLPHIPLLLFIRLFLSFLLLFTSIPSFSFSFYFPIFLFPPYRILLFVFERVLRTFLKFNYTIHKIKEVMRMDLLSETA
jgi:hypothetical protein